MNGGTRRRNALVSLEGFLSGLQHQPTAATDSICLDQQGALPITIPCLHAQTGEMRETCLLRILNESARYRASCQLQLLFSTDSCSGCLSAMYTAATVLLRFDAFSIFS